MSGGSRWLRAHAVVALLSAVLVGCVIATAPLAQAQAQPSAADVEAFVQQIEDPAAHAALVNNLRLLAAAQEQAAGEADLIGRVLGFLSERVRTVSEAFASAVASAGGTQLIWKWLAAQVEVPERRALWIAIVWKLAVVVGAGLAVGWLIARALRGPRRLIEQRSMPDLWIRLPLLLARALLEMAPIGGFYAATSVALAAVQPDAAVRLVALAAINAAVLATAVIAVARLVFTPLAPALRLIALEDETAAYAFVWVRRLVLVPVVGFFAAEAALGLRLPGAGYVALLKLVGLLDAALLVVLILQVRRPVAIRIRGEDAADGGFLGVRALRQRVADIWHILALLYLAATYLIWAFEIAGGFAFIVRANLLTVVILFVARALRVVLRRAVDWLFRVSEVLAVRFPALQVRANAYVAGLRRLVDLGFTLVAFLLVAQAWSIDVFGWLAEGVGHELLIRAIEIAAAILVAVVVWEIASGAIATYLAGGDQRQGRAGQSQRPGAHAPAAGPQRAPGHRRHRDGTLSALDARREHRPAPRRCRRGRPGRGFRGADAGQGRDHRRVHPVRGYGARR